MVVLGTGEDYEGINRSELKRVEEFTKAAQNQAELEAKYNDLFAMYLEDEKENDGQL